MISREEISVTATRIAPYVRRTPAIEVNVPGVARPVTLKLEHLQVTGSFKPRGAFANLLGADVPEAGVTAASGGNHGAAVAYAARALGHRATIFVPAVASRAKVERIASYGARVVQEGAVYYDALANCHRFAAETRAREVHAYDVAATLLGQGTLACEFEEQVPGLDTILVAVGGGGLIGGIAAWYAGRTRVIGIEPRTCNALHAALAAGEPTAVVPSGRAVDSLGASTIGTLAFEIASRHVERVALVTDDAIRDAQVWLWNELRGIVEPGGACALAALLSGAYAPERGERVGVVVCGANTDPAAVG